MLSFETVSFYWKKVLEPIMNPTCGLLCLSSYWENMNNQSDLPRLNRKK